jgi:Tol biopolymer transport system component
LPLTGNQGLEGQPAFSPDGNQVAYSWNGIKEDNFDIYVKLIGPGAPLRLTTDRAPDVFPTWSPDGRRIAFLRQRSDEFFEIMLIPALGGTERKIGEAFMRIGGHPAWTPDSQHLIVAGRPTAQEPNGLSIISISTGEMRALTVPPFAAIGGDGQPALSPDGRTLAFIRGPSGASLDVFTVPFQAGRQPVGTPRKVTFDSRSLWPAWSPDGRDLIYSSYVLGQTVLLRVPADGSGKPERLTGVGEGGINLAISPSAHRLVYVRQSVDENIWRIRVPDGRAEPASRLIASTLRDFEPRFSPDGRKILYASDRSGYIEVWTADADGSNQVQLTDLKTSLTAGARWSPDGQQVVFLSLVGGQLELFTIPAGGGAVRRLTNNPAHDTAPSWSHDGKWIYFGSNRSGEFQIWKIPAGGGDAIRLTSNGGFAALESCDGKYVYYTHRPSGDGIWRIPTTGGEEKQVIPGIDLWGNFTVTERGIYFVPSEKGSIRFFDFGSRRVHEVAKIDKPVQFGLSATADGQFVLFTQTDRETDELMLVENFH